jgi:hypothetical protein
MSDMSRPFDLLERAFLGDLDDPGGFDAIDGKRLETFNYEASRDVEDGRANPDRSALNYIAELDAEGRA